MRTLKKLPEATIFEQFFFHFQSSSLKMFTVNTKKVKKDTFPVKWQEVHSWEKRGQNVMHTNFRQFLYPFPAECFEPSRKKTREKKGIHSITKATEAPMLAYRTVRPSQDDHITLGSLLLTLPEIYMYKRAFSFLQTEFRLV